MGIYRCNKCGNMAEHDYQQGMADIACQKCSQPVKVYDTLFFVGIFSIKSVSSFFRRPLKFEIKVV